MPSASPVLRKKQQCVWPERIRTVRKVTGGQNRFCHFFQIDRELYPKEYEEFLSGIFLQAGSKSHGKSQ
jgi:hypothetical protein